LKSAFLHQRFPHREEIGCVDSEHVNCDPTDSRSTAQFGSDPLEVLTPSILPRMEQPHELPGSRISSSNIRTFVPVAVKARQSEICKGSYTAMLACNDVIDVKRQRISRSR